MFMSFSKTIAKVGGFRFGIRMRLTKSNALWYYLALSVILTCQLFWYGMVLAFWLMYAFLYGIFWCIKKPYVLLAKKLGKPKAAAIVAGFLAFLVLIGSCNKDKPTNSTQQTEQQSVTSNQKVETDVRAVNAVEKWVSSTEESLAVFNFHDIVSDESGATVSLAINDLSQKVANMQTSGYGENYEPWVEFRDAAVSLCNDLAVSADTCGLKNYSIILNVLDDQNHDITLLSINNGAITYDCMSITLGLTTGQKNALASARSYLGYSAFSHDGLIGQLEYEGYTTEEATFAADNCGADWNEQALAKALSYLDYSAFSYTGLIGQLEYEKFTTEQATYGVDNCGADWNEQAVKKAKSYLEYSSFSKDKLIGQLEYEGFTHEQAVYGAEANGY